MIKIRSHKYLNECGFSVFIFGENPKTGTVDLSNKDGEEVATGLTTEQANQVQRYIDSLEEKTKKYIERRYW